MTHSRVSTVSAPGKVVLLYTALLLGPAVLALAFHPHDLVARSALVAAVLLSLLLTALLASGRLTVDRAHIRSRLDARSVVSLIILIAVAWHHGSTTGISVVSDFECLVALILSRLSPEATPGRVQSRRKPG